MLIIIVQCFLIAQSASQVFSLYKAPNNPVNWVGIIIPISQLGSWGCLRLPKEFMTKVKQRSPPESQLRPNSKTWIRMADKLPWKTALTQLSGFSHYPQLQDRVGFGLNQTPRAVPSEHSALPPKHPVATVHCSRIIWDLTSFARDLSPAKIVAPRRFGKKRPLGTSRGTLVSLAQHPCRGHGTYLGNYCSQGED